MQNRISFVENILLVLLQSIHTFFPTRHEVKTFLKIMFKFWFYTQYERSKVVKIVSVQLLTIFFVNTFAKWEFFLQNGFSLFIRGPDGVFFAPKRGDTSPDTVSLIKHHADKFIECSIFVNVNSSHLSLCNHFGFLALQIGCDLPSSI